MTKPPAPPYLGPPAHHSGLGNKPITRIVIHCTVSRTIVGGARQIARYFQSQKAGGSAHYVVDPGEAIQSAFDSVVCWHAPPNPHSLGVELCDPMTGPGARWDDRPHREMVTRAAKLVAQLCLAYDVPIRKLTPADLKAGRQGICGHVDVSKAFKQSTHWDPGPDFPWRRFINQVQGFAEKPTTPVPTPKPPVTAAPVLVEEDPLYQCYDAKDGRGIHVVTANGAIHIKNETHLNFLRKEGHVTKDVETITKAQLDALLEKE